MKINRNFNLTSATSEEVDPWLDDILSFAEVYRADYDLVARATKKRSDGWLSYIVAHTKAKRRVIIQRADQLIRLTLFQTPAPAKTGRHIKPQYERLELAEFVLADPLQRLEAAKWMADRLCVDTPYSLGTVEKVTVGVRESSQRYGGCVTRVEAGRYQVTVYFDGGKADIDADHPEAQFVKEGDYLVFSLNKRFWMRFQGEEFDHFFTLVP